MKQASKYVLPLEDNEYFQLKEILSQSTGAFYTRIKGILLSLDKYSIDEIADILNVHRNTVSIWIDSFDNNGIDGLKLKDGRGRKPIISTEKEQEIAIKCVNNNPTSIKCSIEEIKNKTGKVVSPWTLKRLLKKKK
jgi:transposase